MARCSPDGFGHLLQCPFRKPAAHLRRADRDQPHADGVFGFSPSIRSALYILGNSLISGAGSRSRWIIKDRPCELSFSQFRFSDIIDATNTIVYNGSLERCLLPCHPSGGRRPEPGSRINCGVARPFPKTGQEFWQFFNRCLFQNLW